MINTDFQPYLVPETDTWALSEDKAIKLLRYLESQGVQQVICTPPIRKGNEANTKVFLKKQLAYLQEAYMGEVKLRLSARYRLDEGFPLLLHAGELLPLNVFTKGLLVDVSPLEEVAGLWEMLETIFRAGYIPVIMQPERTIYWGTEEFVRLKEMGCRLMLNLYSLFGYNGDEALNYSRMLLRRGMYTYMCSGMEDTKVMSYIEQIQVGEDDALRSALQVLEKNNRLL